MADWAFAECCSSATIRKNSSMGAALFTTDFLTIYLLVEVTKVAKFFAKNAKGISRSDAG